MATSPVGSLDIHDWKRVGEMLIQGIVALFLSNLLSLLPLLQWGKYQPLETIVLLALTEAVKRYSQSPTAPPVA